MILAVRRKAVTLVGQRRRSPRISALNTSSKDNHHQKKGQHLNTRNALPPLSKLAKQVWKGRDGPENGDCVERRSLKGDQKHDGKGKSNGNGNGNGEASVMPAKHILELILDTLQRRDTYEIFGEPVDPDEVEDYYEIIKEPMDFGTMRAKLHEGMYRNLEQFQHDVFLIPENAMHFNSSSTTYFRQARAIHELANKVFHVLKTNPENFVSEFSGTRRRSMRKALSESNPPQCPSTSAFQTSNRKTPAAFHFAGDGRVSNSRVGDRRGTYLCNKDVEKEDPLHSTFYTTSKPLLLMHQGEDVSYEDSLMWYVKDLGATAQMIAKRKLLGQHDSTAKRRCGESKEFKTFRDFAPAGCNPFIKASNTIDLTQEDGEEAKLRHRRKEKTAGIHTPTPSADKVTAGNRNIVSVVRDLNFSSRPVILALENHHHHPRRRHSEFKSRNKKSHSLSKEHQHDEAAQQRQQKEKPLPLISHFTFDLSFFKARLDQMKAANRKGGLSIYE